MPHVVIEHTGRRVEKELVCAVPPAELFAAWNDPERVAHWFVDRAEGGTQLGDVQTWSFDRFKFSMPYEIVASEPGRHYGLRCETPDGAVGHLEITLEEQHDGTRMHFVNSGFAEGPQGDAMLAGCDSGWQIAFTLLRDYVERYPGKARHDILPMRTGMFAYEDLVPFFRTADGLARWLTESGELGAVGSRSELRGVGGLRLTGDVLAHCAWESAMRCEEIDGIVEFKAFDCGPEQRALALRATSWSDDPAHVRALEAPFDAALQRLLELLTSA